MDLDDYKEVYDDFIAQDRTVAREKRFLVALSLSEQCKHVHEQQKTASSGGHGRCHRGLRGRIFKEVQGEISERALHYLRGQKRILGVHTVWGLEE